VFATATTNAYQDQLNAGFLQWKYVIFVALEWIVALHTGLLGTLHVHGPKRCGTK